MSSLNYIGKMLGIKDSHIQNMRETSEEYVLHVMVPVKPHVCPNCHKETTRIKGYTHRTIRHTTTNEKPIRLIYRQRRYSCTCGRTFNEKTEFSTRYLRTTPRLREVVITELSEVKSLTAVAKHCHISVTQVIRIFKEINYSRPKTLPAVLSIDEFKGNAAGQKYQVILTDPNDHKILDILPKRDTVKLIQYFLQFPRHVRNNVKYITMDMSLQFRSVMKQCFPKAHIVADRFHLIRLVTFALERVRKAEQNTLTNASRTFKTNKRILTKHFKDLTDNEYAKLMDMFHYSSRLHRLFISPLQALYMGISVLVIQQLDGNLIKPLLFGKSLNIHPLTIILVLIGAGSVAGIVGMLICIPVYAVIKTLIINLHKIYQLRRESNLFKDGGEG